MTVSPKIKPIRSSMSVDKQHAVKDEWMDAEAMS
jgi:hypothetical protein